MLRVYIRVSYGCVDFRFFVGLELFRVEGWLGSFTAGQGFVF